MALQPEALTHHHTVDLVGRFGFVGQAQMGQTTVTGNTPDLILSIEPGHLVSQGQQVAIETATKVIDMASATPASELIVKGIGLFPGFKALVTTGVSAVQEVAPKAQALVNGAVEYLMSNPPS